MRVVAYVRATFPHIFHRTLEKPPPHLLRLLIFFKREDLTVNMFLCFGSDCKCSYESVKQVLSLGVVFGISAGNCYHDALCYFQYEFFWVIRDAAVTGWKGSERSCGINYKYQTIIYNDLRFDFYIIYTSRCGWNDVLMCDPYFKSCMMKLKIKGRITKQFLPTGYETQQR
jgi:hypothetical protein